MKTLILSAALLAPCAAFAQQGTNVPAGQGNGGVVNASNYLANTDPSGFAEQAQSGNYLSGGTAQAGTGTTQATAAVLPARSNVVACTTGNTALELPAVQRYTPITINNRGTAACLVFPPVGGYVETSAGTLAAVNASASLSAGADVIFRPAIINGLVEFLQ